LRSSALREVRTLPGAPSSSALDPSPTFAEGTVVEVRLSEVDVTGRASAPGARPFIRLGHVDLNGCAGILRCRDVDAALNLG